MRNKLNKRVALVLAIIIICEAIVPPPCSALTSGPSQPEFSGFAQMPTSEMVDLFSGDFHYDIPIMEVPGVGGSYPLNLNYHSVTNAEEEASMVGLGWNLNIGQISREVRAVPDDFNGDKISNSISNRRNWTIGVNGNLNLELFGKDFAKNGVSPKDPSQNPLNIPINAQFFYNNFSGLGLNISASLSLPIKKSGLSSNFGASFSTLDKPTFDAGIGYSSKITKQASSQRQFSIGVSHNTLSGLKSLNFGYGASGIKNPSRARCSYQTAYSFAPVNINDSDVEYEGSDLAYSTKVEVPIIGADPYVASGGFYSEEKLKPSMSRKKTKSYGSIYLENGYINTILDVSTVNDNPIRENQLDLTIVKPNPDLFNIASPLGNSTFTIERGDVGVFTEKTNKSQSSGRTVSLELGGANLVKVGADLEITTSTSHNDITKIGNAYENSSFKFHPKDTSGFEAAYFKEKFELTGETNISNYPYTQSYNYIKEDSALRFSVVDDAKFDFIRKIKIKPRQVLGSDLVTDGVVSSKANIGVGKRLNRKPRKTNLNYITNKQLGNNNPTIRKFTVKLDTSSAPVLNLGENVFKFRSVNRKFGDSKITAMYQTLPSGEEWIYAMPIVNHVQTEATFSINKMTNPCDPNINTGFPSGICSTRILSGNQDASILARENFKSIRTIPAYASSFLLTSILGSNYVDRNNNGPDDADVGHWIRLEYVQTNNKQNPYKWRAPFFGANVNAGYKTLDEDNKANFIYGEKDQVYPYTILTPTHSAAFYYSRRNDALGAGCWLQQTTEPGGAYSYKLDSVRLFFRETNTLIKTVKFNYDYSLCPGVHNSISYPNGGKLTLKSLQIVNYSNQRGSLIPYSFHYFNESNPGLFPYSNSNADRWGVYRNNTSNLCQFSELPYTVQLDSSVIQNDRSQIENRLAEEVKAWHLSSIQLPSGAEINIDIGRDHYAYVQDNKAGQMFKIEGFSDPAKGNPVNKLKNAFDAKLDTIYFRLEKPIHKDNANKKKILSRYFDDLYEDGLGKQIYFKINADLTNYNEYEYVSGYGYMDADLSSASAYGFGIPQNNYHHYGWVVLKNFPEKIKSFNVSPLYVHAWQHLKINLKKLLFRFNPNEDYSKFGKVKMVLDLIQKIPSMFSITKGYFDDCISNEGFSRSHKIDLSKSYIRLCNSDGFKYGDGVRVNKITFKSNWCDEATPLYGMVYDYTKKEKISYFDGTSENVDISSGVALNEPYTGSEENSYKYVKMYTQQVKGSVDEFDFQEYPVMSSELPGPGVGYSKVTVRSLASDYMLKKSNNSVPSGGIYDIPAALDMISSTGQTEHEFYTARDFPTIFDATSTNQYIAFPKYGFIPLLGSLKYNRIIATQGHVAEKNNMHGKSKKVSYYSQNKTGSINPNPVSYTETIYKSKLDYYQRGIKKKSRLRLTNNVTLLNHYKRATRISAELVDGQLGVHRSLSTMIKGSRSFTGKLGADINLDGFVLGIFPAFAPTVWPGFNLALDISHTGLVTKIIEKAGVVDSVRVFDGTSLVSTKNLVFDPYSGEPVLTKVNNEFNQAVFHYNIPARSPYPQMGPAYQNLAYEFKVSVDSLCSFQCDSNEIKLKLPAYAKNILRPGDEFIVTMPNDTMDIATCTYNDFNMCRIVFDTTTNFSKFFNKPNRLMNFYLYRSGRRNQLQSYAAQMQSLCNPTLNYNLVTLAGHSGTGYVNSYTQSNCIIQSSVNTFSEFYDQIYPYSTRCNESQQPSCTYSNMKQFNPYRRGVRGVWLPQDQFSYLSPRNYDTVALKFEQLGTMSNYQHFQYDSPLFRYTPQGANWVNVLSNRKINANAQVLEENNALYIPKSVLTGFHIFTGEQIQISPHYVTASISGSNYFESAFASFEFYENKTYGFSSTPSENYCHFDYFEKPYSITNNIYQVIYSPIAYSYIIDKPFVRSTTGKMAEIYCTNFTNNNSRVLPIALDEPFVIAYKPYQNRTMSRVSFVPCDCQLPSMSSCKIAISDTFRINKILNTELNYSFAHTGNSSLLLRTASSFTFPQKTLNLIPGKNYYFSCWVYTNTSAADLTSLGVKAKILDNKVAIATFDPSGNRINGWQKIEGFFTAPQNQIFDIQFVKSTNADLYLDDLRIAPSESDMTAYVYNRTTNKLEYTLDDNNYYTRYLYDSEGMIIGIMKETEKGVKAIQEFRKYLPDLPRLNCL